jgi:hypothetical protein
VEEARRLSCTKVEQESVTRIHSGSAYPVNSDYSWDICVQGYALGAKDFWIVPIVPIVPVVPIAWNVKIHVGSLRNLRRDPDISVCSDSRTSTEKRETDLVLAC